MRARRERQRPLKLGALFILGSYIAAGCSARARSNTFDRPSLDRSSGAGASGGGDASASSGALFEDAGTDPKPNRGAKPCGSQCGAKELCDPEHLGLDDDCNGSVDEGCPCATGQVHPCFKGDPSYDGKPGCFPGTEYCSELGAWGDCLGGVHATDGCYTDHVACHALTTAPFHIVHLKDGTGTFSANAAPGTEHWKVQCPVGVSPCPVPGGANPADVFQALQSGEYTVTYERGNGRSKPLQCTYPLFVGAPGLRVELSWEHAAGDVGVDLDLQVHEPGNIQPWSFQATTDCLFSNCTAAAFGPDAGAYGPEWFPADAAAPNPAAWSLDPDWGNNTCYNAPRGIGDAWKTIGMGCHNPRLDLDNVQCDPNVFDVKNPLFCAPENINIDVPPKDVWTRIGVHYFSNHLLAYDVHPIVKVFCGGKLSAELGNHGYFKPEAPVTFTAAEGSGTNVGNAFWLVADVAFPEPTCQVGHCVVHPVYADANQRTPLVDNDIHATLAFGPAYPPNL